MPVVLDRPILSRIPDTERAAEFAVGRFTADINQAARPMDHRARTQVAVADASEGNRIGIRTGAESPAWFGGIVEIHHRAAVVAKVEPLLVFEHRVNLAARHSTKMPTVARPWVIAEDLQRHGCASIHAVAWPNTDHEDVVVGVAREVRRGRP